MDESLAVVTKASTEYVGQWNRLISTTNWEKGRIIAEWRSALQEAEATPESYSDEAWSQQVGGVTPQHVGRLRRVYERFGEVHQDYAGLYWSHFQVAVEWSDAEMYLEGAVQNRWSVARMCDQRWEAQGAPAELQPQESDVVSSETDEDMVAVNKVPSATIEESSGEVHGDVAEASYEGSNDSEDSDDGATSYDDDGDSGETSSRNNAAEPASEIASEPVRPFEALPKMPSDMKEAFELFKLSILNHKVCSWEEISKNDVLKVLESLKQLALAPAE